MKKKVYYLNMLMSRDREIYEKILNGMESTHLTIEVQSSNWTVTGHYCIFLVVAGSNEDAFPSQNL